MNQLIYISTAAGDVSAAERDAILRVSQRNNARDGITGVLLFNGRRFLQALEGEQRLVQAAYDRIKADTRHRAIVLLSTRDIAAREFGEWAMAAPGGDEAETLVGRIDRLTANAGESTRAHFMSYAAIGPL